MVVQLWGLWLASIPEGDRASSRGAAMQPEELSVKLAESEHGKEMEYGEACCEALAQQEAVADRPVVGATAKASWPLTVRRVADLEGDLAQRQKAEDAAPDPRAP